MEKSMFVWLWATTVTACLLAIPPPTTAGRCEDWVNRTTQVAEIPMGVTEVFANGLEGCLTMRLVNFPTNFARIGSMAFAFSVNLARILIPDTVVSIGFNAFLNCTGLESVEIGRSVTTLGYGVFRLCQNLVNLTILSNRLTEIPEGLCDECNNLKYLTLPNSINTIGPNFCTHCGLETFTHSNITTIAECAFAESEHLRQVTLSNTLQISVADTAFQSTGCQCCTLEMFNNTCDCRVACADRSGSSENLHSGAVAGICAGALILFTVVAVIFQRRNRIRAPPADCAPPLPVLPQVQSATAPDVVEPQSAPVPAPAAQTPPMAALPTEQSATAPSGCAHGVVPPSVAAQSPLTPTLPVAALKFRSHRPRVFVSHVAQESDSTFKLLVSALRGRRFEVFEPTSDLVLPSVAEMQAWVADSDVVLAVLSPNFFKSKFCCAEAAAAKEIGITVIPVYDGDAFRHRTQGSEVLKWKTEETRESTQALRDYVYTGNLVRAVDTQSQTTAIESVFTAIAERCPSLNLGDASC